MSAFGTKKVRLWIWHDKLACGGVARALLDLIHLLDKDRFDVTLFVLRSGFVWEEKIAETGVRILRPKALRPKTIPGRAMAYFISFLKYRLHPGYDETALENHVHEKFDLVISFKNFLIPEQCKKLAPKAIAYVHQDISSNDEFKSTDKEIRALKGWDRIVCVSAKAKQAMESVTGSGDRVCLLYNPIDAQAVCALAKQPPKIPLPASYICSVTRLSPEKGIIRLLYIFQRLRDAGIQTDLVIVGDGPEMRTLQYILRGLCCRDHVVLAGYDENPYPYIAGSRLTVISSYTEGLPVVAAASLCLGVPVVSSYPSVSEIFADETCGLITENDDDSLYEGMLRMLTDQKLYQDAVTAAKRRGEYFKSDALIQKVEETYWNVIQS